MGNSSYLEFVIPVTLMPDEAFSTLLSDLGLGERLYKDHFGDLIDVNRLRCQ